MFYIPLVIFIARNVHMSSTLLWHGQVKHFLVVLVASLVLWIIYCCVSTRLIKRLILFGFKGQCNGQNLGAIFCVAKIDLSPKDLSNPVRNVTRSKSLINAIIGHEYHEQAVGYNLAHWGLSWILLQPCQHGQWLTQYFKPLLDTEYSGRHSPHEFH